MSAKSLGPVIDFRDLSDAERLVVAEEIVKSNRLNISLAGFVERAARNFLILRTNGDIEKFVSIGLKELSPKLRESLLSEQRVLRRNRTQGVSLDLFFKRLLAGELLERGWATNLTGIARSLSSLSRAFDSHLKKLGKDRSYTFCTVVTNNEAGNASAQRSGYKWAGEFQSPYSSNRLNLYVFARRG
jgi:hypothetical protein